MVEPLPNKERYCTALVTHDAKRIMSSDALGHVVAAHCPSPTCTWCATCYTVHTRRRPS